MIVQRAFVLALSMSTFSLVGCGDSGEGEEAGAVPEVDCAAKPVPKYTEMATVWAKCTTCHSSGLVGPAARSSAPDAYNYDTYAAAKATIDTAMAEVYEGAMPLAGSPDLTADEEDILYRWGQCGTPN